MELSAVHVVFVTLGFALGSFIAWLILRSRLALAEANGRSSVEIERASLAERLNAALNETSGFRTRLLESEERARKLQFDLDKANRETTLKIALVENMNGHGKTCGRRYEITSLRSQ